MWLQWVDLDRFRNLKRQKVLLHPRYNLLLGRNGQGKTNFLEAVGYLGTLRSFRSAGRSEMIRHNETMCRVSGKVISEKLEREPAFTLTRKERTQFLSDKKVTSPEEYLQALKVVHFIPEDVGLVSGPPSWRRKVIDRSVFEITPSYLPEYRTYLQVLRQRNALLRRGGASQKELESWNRTLASKGAQLVWRRQQIIRELNPVVEEFGEQLGLGPGLGLEYIASHFQKSSLDPRPEPDIQVQGQPGAAAVKVDDIEQYILIRLADLAAKEAHSGYTLAGPHRDNVIFTLGEKADNADLARYGSQGQKRSAVLAFKLALAVIYQKANGSWPLVLLDDVASELDEIKRKALGSIIRQTRAQFFISTTGEEYMFLPAKEGTIFQVVDGCLEMFKTQDQLQS